MRLLFRLSLYHFFVLFEKKSRMTWVKPRDNLTNKIDDPINFTYCLSMWIIFLSWSRKKYWRYPIWKVWARIFYLVESWSNGWIQGAYFGFISTSGKICLRDGIWSRRFGFWWSHVCINNREITIPANLRRRRRFFAKNRQKNKFFFLPKPRICLRRAFFLFLSAIWPLSRPSPKAALIIPV